MPSYIDPRTGKDNPAIEDRYVTVVFTYAADDESDSAMRGELVERIEELCESFGCSSEIHSENMLAS